MNAKFRFDTNTPGVVRATHAPTGTVAVSTTWTGAILALRRMLLATPYPDPDPED